MLDSYAITMKQNVRFQERISAVNFELNQIQNGPTIGHK